MSRVPSHGSGVPAWPGAGVPRRRRVQAVPRAKRGTEQSGGRAEGCGDALRTGHGAAWAWWRHALVSCRLPLLSLFLLLALAAGTQSVSALTPEEILGDPGLEQRARDLSRQLRCPVCQNQSIDDSDAELARDLRVEVRRLLREGASDGEVLASLRATYGDFVLLNPPLSPSTYILWASPLVILLAGGVIAVFAMRGSGSTSPGRADTGPARAARRGPKTVSAGAGKAAGPADGGRTYLSWIAMGCLVMALSLGLYLVLGRADLADTPLDGRAGEIRIAADQQLADAAALRGALARARGAAEESPNSVEAWLELAAAASATGESETELLAIARAEDLTGGLPAIRAMRAQALSRHAGGQVTIPARRIVEDILATHPQEPRALFLRGLAAYQDGDFAGAIVTWRHLRRVTRPGSQLDLLLDDYIAQAEIEGGVAPQIDDETIAAADELSEEERTAFIANMVAGLAARLQENPDDAEGWGRLVRAYEVLGRTRQTQTALIGLADALPDNADAQSRAIEHLVVNQLEREFDEDATRLLARLGRLAPDRPETLYITGHFARIRGEPDKARRIWRRLLERIPPDAPIAETLKSEIDAL